MRRVFYLRSNSLLYGLILTPFSKFINPFQSSYWQIPSIPKKAVFYKISVSQQVEGARAYNQRIKGLSYLGTKSCHILALLARLQDFELSWKSVIGPECGNNWLLHNHMEAYSHGFKITYLETCILLMFHTSVLAYMYTCIHA